jgi:hypothetical protein
MGSNFSLGNLLDLKLHQYEDDVLEIVDRAQKELTIEKQLKKLADTWKSLELGFPSEPDNPDRWVRLLLVCECACAELSMYVFVYCVCEYGTVFVCPMSFVSDVFKELVSGLLLGLDHVDMSLVRVLCTYVQIIEYIYDVAKAKLDVCVRMCMCMCIDTCPRAQVNRLDV